MKNSFLITEHEKRQILSLYGLLNENTTQEVKLSGKVISNEENINFKKLEIQIKQNGTIIKKTTPNSDGTWEVNVQLELGKFEIFLINPDFSKTRVERNLTVSDTEISNIDIKSSAEKTEQAVSVITNYKKLILKFLDYPTKKPIENLEVSLIVKEKIEDEDLEVKTKYFTNENGEIKIFENFNSITKNFYLTNTDIITYELKVNKDGYKPKSEVITLTNQKDEVYSFNLMPLRTVNQELDDYENTLGVPQFYNSTRNVFYGRSGDDSYRTKDKNLALLNAKKDAYNQFLKTIRKKYRENEIVKNTLPEDGEIVFRFPETQPFRFYIVKYKRRDLKRFVKSLLKVPDDEEIDIKENKIIFENISLNTAFAKSNSQGKNIFILLGNNETTNLNEVLELLESDQKFVNDLNNNKICLKIPVDDNSENYKQLTDVVRDNGVSIRSYPRIIYLNKNKKILKDYDFYTITTDKTYQL